MKYSPENNGVVIHGLALIPPPFLFDTLLLSSVIVHDVTIKFLLDLVRDLLARVAHLVSVEEGEEEVVDADQRLDVLVGGRRGGRKPVEEEWRLSERKKEKD